MGGLMTVSRALTWLGGAVTVPIMATTRRRKITHRNRAAVKAHVESGAGAAPGDPPGIRAADTFLRMVVQFADPRDLARRETVADARWFKAEAPLYSCDAVHFELACYILAGLQPTRETSTPGAVAPPDERAMLQEVATIFEERGGMEHAYTHLLEVLMHERMETMFDQPRPETLAPPGLLLFAKNHGHSAPFGLQTPELSQPDSATMAGLTELMDAFEETFMEHFAALMVAVRGVAADG